MYILRRELTWRCSQQPAGNRRQC